MAKEENLLKAIDHCTKARVILCGLDEKDNDYTNAAIERLELAQDSINARLKEEL